MVGSVGLLSMELLIGLVERDEVECVEVAEIMVGELTR